MFALLLRSAECEFLVEFCLSSYIITYQAINLHYRILEKDDFCRKTFIVILGLVKAKNQTTFERPVQLFLQLKTDIFSLKMNRTLNNTIVEYNS